MPRTGSSGFDTPKNIANYLRIVLTQAGLLVQTLAYNDVRRLVQIDSDDVSVNSDCEDGLAQVFVEGLERLQQSTRSTDVMPLASIAALFENGELQRSLKPKCTMVMDLRSQAEVVACMIFCRYIRDETLGTHVFTAAFLQRYDAPGFSDQWLFVDVVSSRKKPGGAVLLVTAILASAKQKMVGVCLVAVSALMRDLCLSLGFTVLLYKDHGTRYLCYMKNADFHFDLVMKKLRFTGDKRIVEDVCWRNGLTSRTKDRVIGRCG
jgi:hypothetical protein